MTSKSCVNTITEAICSLSWELSNCGTLVLSKLLWTWAGWFAKEQTNSRIEPKTEKQYQNNVWMCNKTNRHCSHMLSPHVWVLRWCVDVSLKSLESLFLPLHCSGVGGGAAVQEVGLRVCVQASARLLLRRSWPPSGGGSDFEQNEGPLDRTVPAEWRRSRSHRYFETKTHVACGTRDCR